MQKLLLGMLATMLLLAPLAAAETYEGTVLVGHPVTGIIGGASELVEPCSPGGLLEGVDGVWFDIGAAGDRSFTLTMSLTLDADVWFYTSSCDLIGSSIGAMEGLGVTESGVVPAGSAYAVVDGYLGSGSFTLEII